MSDEYLRNQRRRTRRARHFPDNTCPASRHLHLIAEALAAGKPYPMLTEKPEHCAETMLSVLESLFKLRTAAQAAGLRTHYFRVTPKQAKALKAQG